MSKEEISTSSAHENGHRSEHHHSHSHHRHHSHHSHHSHHTHHSHRTSRHKGLFKGEGTLKERILRLLPASGTSSGRKLSKFANSRKDKKVSKYTATSRRIFFVTIVLSIMIFSIYSMKRSEENIEHQMASFTPSETTQLKRQISSLQAEVESLTEELTRYKELYGELKTEQNESDAK